MVAERLHSRARSLSAQNDRPGGIIRPFWEAATTTSIPQSRIRSGSMPREHTPSTTYSAGWSAASMAARIAARSVTAPVEVSVWTMHTLRIRWEVSAARMSATSAGSVGCRMWGAVDTTS